MKSVEKLIQERKKRHKVSKTKGENTSLIGLSEK